MKKNVLYYFFLFLCLNASGNNLAHKKKEIIFHYSTLVDSTKIKYVELTMIEGQELIKQFKGVESLEFKTRNIFKLKDGRYLFIGKRACYLYFSKQDILKLLFSSTKSEHVLYNLNKYGSDFPRNINVAISKMNSLLGLERSKLDFSEESLSYIDNKIIKDYVKNHISYVDIKRNIMGLIAYAGEVYIKKNGGKWKMVLAKDGETWEPFIDTPINNNFDLYVWVQDSLLNYEDDEYPSISAGYLARTNMLFKKK